MILSDATIRQRLTDGTIVMEPLDDSQVQPASVDFRLGDEFLVFDSHTHAAIDPRALPDDLSHRIRVRDGEPFVLHPGEFALGTSLERLALPDDVVARVEGKSSLGRLGLLIHVTAGFVDPGWPLGQITLELANVANLPIKLWPGMRIGQMSFQMLDRPAERPYGHPALNSKYTGQQGPVASQYHRN